MRQINKVLMTILRHRSDDDSPVLVCQGSFRSE